MKAKYHIIYIALIVILLVVIFWPSEPNSDNEKIEQDIKKSELKIDSLANVNIELQKEREVKGKAIDSLKVIIKTLKGKTITIDKETDEKINNVNSYTPNELQQYFTDRYSR